MCRPSCTWPEWYALPKGPVGLPVVHGAPMTEEEYRVSGWHSRGTYVTGRNQTEHLWIAPLERLQEWGRRSWQEREQRISTAQAKRAADEEWSDNVVQMIEDRNRR